MPNYKITWYNYGYESCDVVSAEDRQHAIDYWCWIRQNQVLPLKIKKCTDLPNYWCPLGWISPETREDAIERSLIKSLKVAGISQHDYYTPELDQVLKSLGYTAKRAYMSDGYYMVYNRPGHQALFIKIKEDT